MARVHFGWTMPSGVTRENRAQHLELIEHGLEMVKGKFDSAWLADHLQFENRDVLESWTALAYVAARHPEFQFGNAVLCQSFRNPGRPTRSRLFLSTATLVTCADPPCR